MKKLLLACLLAVPASAQTWQQTYQALAIQPGQAKAALEFLQGQPLEVKKTMDFHISLARAARAAEDPFWAARAVLVIRLVFRADPGPGLAEVTSWLGQRGLALHRKSLDLLAAGDELAAARKYLGAVRCEQAVLGFNDRRLRDRAYSILDTAIKKEPNDADSWGNFAFYSYFFGRTDTAKEALRKGIELQKDEYLKWLYEQGLAVLEKEPALAASPPDPVATQYSQDRQKQITEELERVQKDPSLQQSGEPSPTSTGPGGWGKVKEELALKRKVIQQLTSDLKSAAVTKSNFRD